MKSKNFGFMRPAPCKTVIKSLAALLIVCCLTIGAQAQDWAQEFMNVPSAPNPPVAGTNYNQTHENETILLKFDGASSGTYPTGATIMFRAVEDHGLAPDITIMVTLLDINGNQLVSDIYESSFGIDFIPVTAAHNPASPTNNPYIVCSNSPGNGAPMYMTFDSDLNLSQSGQLSNGFGLTVTDICPVTNNAPFEYAITGQGINTLFQNHLFIMEFDPAGPCNYMETALTSLNTPLINDIIFPACITEIDAPANGGYFVGGTVGSEELFYLRAGYNLAANDLSLYSIGNSNLDLHNAQSAIYDQGQDVILIAGIANLPEANMTFFYDKISNVSSFASNNSAALRNNTSSYSWLGGPGAYGLPYHNMNPTWDPNFQTTFGWAYTEGIFQEDWNPNPLTRMIGVRLMECNYISPVHGSNTNNLPALLEVDYNDATTFNAGSWPGTPGMFQHSAFPRQISTGFYYDAYDATKQYPSQLYAYQQFVKHDFNTPGAGAMHIGTTGMSTGIREQTAILSNGSTMWNNCYTETLNPEPTNPVNIVDVSGVNTQNSSLNTVNLINMPMNLTNIAVPIASNWCNSTPFKPGKGGIEEQLISKDLWSSNGMIYWNVTDEIKTINIYDMSGKVVLSLGGEDLKLVQYNLADLPAALYLVELQKINHQKEVIKVLP